MWSTKCRIFVSFKNANDPGSRGGEEVGRGWGKGVKRVATSLQTCPEWHSVALGIDRHACTLQAPIHLNRNYYRIPKVLAQPQVLYWTPEIKSEIRSMGIITRRAFLKRPENFSGPKTFRGSFRVNFSGPGKRFSTGPKTPRILTRVFRVVSAGLQRELDSDLFWEPKLTRLHWVAFLKYATNHGNLLSSTLSSNHGQTFGSSFHLYSFNTACCTLIDRY